MTADFAAECHNPHSVRAAKALERDGRVSKKGRGARVFRPTMIVSASEARAE